MIAERPAGLEQMDARLAALGVRESDLEETFVRSSGHGGQNVNKTSTCVQLVHRPTGVIIKCQETRHQGRNRSRARELLAEKLEAMRHQARAEARAQVEKLRRQKRPRSQASKRRMLESKSRQASKKSMRRRPGDD